MKAVNANPWFLAALLIFLPWNSAIKAQSVSITGTVKNSSSTALSGVGVSLKKYSKLSTTTNASGVFNLVGSTAIDGLNQSEPISFGADGTVFLHLTNSPVRIDVFNVAGQLVVTLLDKQQLSGNYKICPMAYVAGTNQIFIVRVIAGNELKSCKFIDRENTIEKGLYAVADESVGLLLKSSMAVVDTLVLSHTSYLTKKIALSSLQANLGTVVMDAKISIPAAPSSLASSVVSSSKINLSWKDNSNNETLFRIERAPGGTSSFAEIATVSQNVTSYQNTGLSASTAYVYRVRAYNTAGNSGYSNTSSATTQAPPVTIPNAPSVLSAVAASSSQINLSWKDNSNNETLFRIERAPGGTSSFTEIATVSQNVTSYQNTGLSASTAYVYRVRAYNTAGNSGYSNTSSASTQAPPVTIPNAPSALSAVAASSSQINLSWTDNSTDETLFRIERAPGGTSSYAEIATVSQNVTSYQNTGLSASTAYVYRVRAYNTAGNSGYSNTSSASTQAPPVTIPNAPSALSAVAASSSQINLSWTDNSTDETLFRIERAPGGTSSYAEIATVSQNVTSYQNTGLPPSTNYLYRVRAYNSAGNSSYSNTATTGTLALNYSFPGGTLADLKLVSPNLVFGNLTIAGKLNIPSTESNVTITAANLDVNAMVGITWPTCSPYYDGPNLTINCAGTVNINSPVNLNGMLAKDQPNPTPNCNSCYGPDGGDLIINAGTINMNNYVQTYGGQGARYYAGSYYEGCSGGDGGNITLNAVSALTVNATAADFDFYGGSGGVVASPGSNGATGGEGTLDFEGAAITVAEIGGDINMYKYNAQKLDYEKLTVNGTLSKGEESSHRNGTDAWYINYSGGITDWLEDLYVVYLPSGGTIKATLSASNGLADLDMFVLNYSMLSILGTSNGSGSNESITTGLLGAGKYIVAVSFADDCPNNVTTNYTLKLNP